MQKSAPKGESDSLVEIAMSLKSYFLILIYLAVPSLNCDIFIFS